MIQVLLIGRVGQNPTRSEHNDKVVNFSIAAEIKQKDKEPLTQWYQVEAWNGQGDAILEHVKKGKQMFVEGSLRLETYVNKEGEVVPSGKVTLKTFYFCGTKDDNKNAEQQSEVVEMTTKRSRK